jgi:ElaB/YqjD/DUF883 family membrane-anchored ribosome-binding protein
MSTRTESTADEPRTVGEARDAVERSRQRISSTLDQLEDRIVEKKHEIRERVDVLRPVREQIAERPFTALAVAAGVGALLGSIGGGADDDDGHSHSRSGRVRGHSLSDDDRRELREWRRARKQRLRARLHDDADDDRGSSRFDALKHQLMGAVTSAITTAVTKRVRQLAMDNIGGHDGNGAAVRGAREREDGTSRSDSWS